MIDFNIRRGLSSVLFSEPGVVNPRLVIEEGCWYLCTDTAELFLGVSTEEGLALKRINGSAKNPADEPTTGEGELVSGIIGASINEAGELIILFADGTEESLGVVVGANGQDGQDGKDGLTTAVKIGDTEYVHVNGVIELPSFLTIDDLSSYAKKEDIPEAEIYKVDFNTPDFAAAIEAYNSGKLLLLVNAAPDVNSYAVMNYVREDKITFTKFLMSRSETYGAFNTYYLSPDNTWEVSKEVKLNKVEITDDGNLQVGKQTLEIPSVEGFATESYVDNAIANIEHPANPTKISEFENDAGYITSADIPETDFSDYYNKEEVDAKIPSLDGYAKVEDIPTDYVKESDLEGYSKFSGSYNDLTDKPEIPSIAGLASIEYVQEEIGKIDIPEADLSGLVSTETFEAEITKKADKILFPSAKFVTKPIGNFVVGEDLNGVSIADLFAKLLGLTDTKPGENPEEPDVPTEPEGVVEEIIANKLPMYSVNADNEIIAGSYDDVIIYTEATAQEEPTEFGFYQITNEAGEVVESGYQELTADNPNVPYIIALPVGVDFNTMVTTQTYDTLEGTWKNDSLEMSNDYSTISGLCEALFIDISHIDTEKFTLWADLSSGQGPSGKIHRFIINE